MFELPEAPAGVIALVSLFTPYLVAIVNGPRLSPTQKRVVSVAGSLVVSGVSLALYYAMTGEAVPHIAPLLILGLLVSQSVYALLGGAMGAKAVEERVDFPPTALGRYGKH